MVVAKKFEDLKNPDSETSQALVKAVKADPQNSAMVLYNNPNKPTTPGGAQSAGGQKASNGSGTRPSEWTPEGYAKICDFLRMIIRRLWARWLSLISSYGNGFPQNSINRYTELFSAYTKVSVVTFALDGNVFKLTSLSSS